MFDLFLDKKEKIYEEMRYRGKIIIDDFEEYFFSSDSFFKREDYYRHWLKSIGLLFKYSKAFFLTDVYDPSIANNYMSWECHLLNGVVYVQETMLPNENFNENFHEFFSEFYDEDYYIRTYCLRDVIYSSVEIDDIEFTTDDGDKISTWQTDVRSIKDFKKRLEKRLAKKSS